MRVFVIRMVRRQSLFSVEKPRRKCRNVVSQKASVQAFGKFLNDDG